MSETRDYTQLPISSRQVLILSITGAVLWLVGALLLKMLAPMGIYEGTARILVYILIIPGTLPFILLALRLAGLTRAHFALACAIVVATATLLDGIALAWFPQIYGSTLEHIAGAGGTILWGGGVALALGLILNKTKTG